MAGLLIGAVALPGGLTTLPARGKGSFGVQQGVEQQQQQPHVQLRGGAACALAVACSSDGLASPVVAELASGGAGGTSMAVGTRPPRVANHTRRLVVPAYALAGTRTLRRGGSGGAGGGNDDELGGGGDDGNNFWGGDGGGGDDGGFWGSGDEGSEGGNLAARLQDLLVLWSLFCGIAFAQAVCYVSPKPKAAAVSPAFAALSYSGIKASLLQRRAQPAAC